tara:strand:- start:7905 stop:8252 length:348 start_codon:yes stop_codon:yes gene_type:complete
MNIVKLTGRLMTNDISRVKLNSGYLNNVLFQPDYKGRGFVNNFKLEINQADVSDVNTIIEKMIQSDKDAVDWTKTELKCEVEGCFRANNYDYTDMNGVSQKVYQNILEVHSLTFV